MIEGSQRRRERGFQSDNTVRRLFKVRLFGCGMRRVVGNDAVDRAVEDALFDRRNVIGRAQRRVHPVIGIALQKQLIGQQEVMRGGLAGDIAAGRLRLPDSIRAAACRDMADVKLCTGFQRHLQIALRDRILGKTIHALDAERLGNRAFIDNSAVDDRQILAMGNDRKAGFLCLCERGFHHLCGRDRSAVIRERRNAGGFERFIIRELFAFQPDGQRTGLMYIDAGCLCTREKFTYLLRIIHRRRGIRHTEYARDTACKRCRCSGIDVLFVRLTGVAEMHMHIKQSRQCGKSRAVDDAVCLCFDMRPDPGDFAVFQEHIANCVPQAVSRADIADEYGFQRVQPPSFSFMGCSQMPSQLISFSSSISIWTRCPAK